MRGYVSTACAVAAACFGTVGFAQSDGAATAARFGALEDVAQASLSPDGKKVAFVSEAPAGSQVFVANLDVGGDPHRVLAMPRSTGRLTRCSWTGPNRIVCNAYYVLMADTFLTSATRLFAVDADGKNLQRISVSLDSNARGYYVDGGRVIDYNVPDKPGTVLMTRQFLPNDHTGSNIGSSREGLGVEAVDTNTDKHSIVEQPRADAFWYGTDGHGNVRLMGTLDRTGGDYLRGTTTYFYRKLGERGWTKLSAVSEDGHGFDPYRIDPDKNVVYGFDDDGDYRSLYTMSLDGSKTETKVLGRPGFDIDELITIGRAGRVVGTSYATERREAEYFDPELKSLTEKLHRALPSSPAVDIVDASADEKRLLIVASSDTQPGQFYLFDKDTQQLAEVLPARPLLANTPLGTMKAITFRAADGTSIPGYLTLPPGSNGKNLPAIVMPHGGPNARDEWGFDWLVQFFAARGYAVLQPNYRGSAGYGAAFFQKNGFQGWRTAIGDVNDAGRWLVSQGIAAPGKLAIVGWSYGGYAALQSAVLDPDLFKAIVAVAPVVDLAKLKSDHARYTDSLVVSRFVGDGPHVREGSPAQNVDRIKAPVLLFSGDHDLNVDVSHARMMNSKLKDAGKDVTYVEFPGLDHQLYDFSARTKLLTESDAFLRKELKLTAN